VRRVAAALAALGLAAAGCGGGGGGGGGGQAANCSDQVFRAQDEELYVAQATVQNALGSPGSTDLVAQLRQGARLLRTYVDAHPPCDDDLRAAADLERGAATAIGEAADELQASPGSDAATAKLGQALRDLQEASRRIRPTALPG
jgi:hypothetical protein